MYLTLSLCELTVTAYLDHMAPVIAAIARHVARSLQDPSRQRPAVSSGLVAMAGQVSYYRTSRHLTLT